MFIGFSLIPERSSGGMMANLLTAELILLQQ